MRNIAGECMRWILKEFLRSHEKFTTKDVLKVTPFPRSTTIENINKLTEKKVLNAVLMNRKKKGRTPYIYSVMHEKYREIMTEGLK